jgi:hypothetical protein
MARKRVGLLSCRLQTTSHVYPTNTNNACIDGLNPHLLSVPGSSSKRVYFIPLSPKSSRTLALHHQEVEAHKADSEDEISPMPSDEEDLSSPTTSLIPVRNRRLSDPSSNRPLISRRTSDNNFSPSSSDAEEDAVEYLPDRFDEQGRSLDRRGLGPPKLHSRKGEFVGKRGGWDVAGQWGVAGTDDVAVDKIVEKVTQVVEGRGSLLGLLGGIISGSLLEPPVEEERRLEDAPRRGGRDVDDDDYDGDYDGGRRRRRRRGSD